MDAQFWHERWEKNQIAFHEGEANAYLVAHFDVLALPPGSRIFVPLCGKTRDIAWLLSQGQRVVGAELSRVAIEQLFAELGAKPEITGAGRMERYSAPKLEIFVGDIFDLSAAMLGAVDAVYDRAALVALPPGQRDRYAAHLREISDRAPQLLICFEYDQSVMQGPPFSVDSDEVARIHGPHYALTRIAGGDVSGGLRGRSPAQETLWHLH